MHIKAKDKVMIMSGVDAGKVGTVKVAYPAEGRVIIEGKDITMMTKHVKPRMQGQPGGRVQMDRTINASNVMLMCSKCNRPVRVKYKTLEDGTKVRYCKWCNESIDN